MSVLSIMINYNIITVLIKLNSSDVAERAREGFDCAGKLCLL
jgi:hypothetical protein